MNIMYSTSRELWVTLLISDSREYPVLKNLTSVMSSLFIVLWLARTSAIRGPWQAQYCSILWWSSDGPLVPEVHQRACARQCIVLDSVELLIPLACTDLCYQRAMTGTVLSLSGREQYHVLWWALSLHGPTDEVLFTRKQSKFILFGHDVLMMIIWLVNDILGFLSH